MQTTSGMVSLNLRGSEMSCKWCNDTGILMRVTKTLHGKDFRPEMCTCEAASIYEGQCDDRKVLIYDVCEAVPKSGDCSKGGVESPESK